MVFPAHANLNIKIEERVCKICLSGPPPKTAFIFCLICLTPELVQDKLTSIVLAAAGKEILSHASFSTWFLLFEGKHTQAP